MKCSLTLMTAVCVLTTAGLAGAGPGQLTISGGVEFSSGSTLTVEIGGDTPGNGSGFYDQVVVQGTVNLGGATLSAAVVDGYALRSGRQYVIISNDGTDAVTGTFSNGNVTSIEGLRVQILYDGGDGNDVAIKAGSRGVAIVIR